MTSRSAVESSSNSVRLDQIHIPDSYCCCLWVLLGFGCCVCMPVSSLHISFVPTVTQSNRFQSLNYQNSPSSNWFMDKIQILFPFDTHVLVAVALARVSRASFACNFAPNQCQLSALIYLCGLCLLDCVCIRSNVKVLIRPSSIRLDPSRPIDTILRPQTAACKTLTHSLARRTRTTQPIQNSNKRRLKRALECACKPKQAGKQLSL